MTKRCSHQILLSDLELLSEFSRNNNKIALSPDKGRGVVISNTANYIDIMSRFLSDLSAVFNLLKLKIEET